MHCFQGATMVFIPKSFLPVVCLSDPAEEIDFSVLRDALRQHPSDFVFFEYGQKLYGLISTGDITRACTDGKRSVMINTICSRVKKEDYIPARKLFLKNPRIHALPVVDESGALLGSFSRFDDLLFLKYWNEWNIAGLSPATPDGTAELRLFSLSVRRRSAPANLKSGMKNSRPRAFAVRRFLRIRCLMHMDASSWFCSRMKISGGGRGQYF